MVFLVIGCVVVSLVAVAIVAIVIVPSASFNSAYTPFVYVPLMLAIFFILHHYDKRKTEAAALEGPLPPTADTLKKICTGSIRSWGMHLNTATKTLSGRGCKNFTARCCHSKLLRSVSPLEDPFEPIPLDESNPQFAALEPASEDMVDSESELLKRKLKRKIAFGGGWGWSSLQFFPLVIASFTALSHRRLSWQLLVWLSLALLTLFGIGGRGGWRPRHQWILVPGGLVIRQIPRFGTDWQVHLFRRTDSVLIMQSTWAQIWTVALSDQVTNSHTTVTSKEAMMLLRAWLSPIAPPPVERLSDLH